MNATLSAVCAVAILVGGVPLAAHAQAASVPSGTTAADVPAKELARTAETTAATYATLRNGSFRGMTIAKLDRLEPSLRNPGGIATLVSVSAKRASFRVTTRSHLTGDTFSIVWTNSGKVHRHCTGAAPACLHGGW